MKLSFTADGMMKMLDINSKVSVLLTNPVSANTVMTAMEMCLSGEPMLEYVRYDDKLGCASKEVTGASLAFASGERVQIGLQDGSWHYTADRRLKTACIRCMPCERGYRYRMLFMDTQSLTEEEKKRVSHNFLVYSDLFSSAEWTRIINGMNAICGFNFVQISGDKTEIIMNKSLCDSDEIYYTLRSIYFIWAMCVVKTMKKFVLLDIDATAESARYMYKLVDMLSSCDIANILVYVGNLSFADTLPLKSKHTMLRA